MNDGKTIKQFALLESLLTDDSLLVQRGNQYFEVQAESLTTGARIETTYANAIVLAGAENLKVGAVYYLTDKYLYLTAVTTTTFLLTGSFLSRNADFQSAGDYGGVIIANGFTVNATGTNLGVWTTALTPASGDIVIWNNLHWLNITGANGATDPSVDSTNWESVPNTDITVADSYGYIIEIDAVEYDTSTDTITRRIDKRSNDIGENSISTWQWGNDNVNNNSVFGDASVVITNMLGTFSGNTLFGNLEVQTSGSNSSFTGISIPYYQGAVTTYINDYANSAFVFIRALLITQVDNIYIYLGGFATNASIELRNSNNTFEAELTATAYAGGTTYSYGDFATSGTVTYLYINPDDTAGNAPPNATYWQEVFDTTTAGRHKLTISKYFNACGTLNLVSTNATETIDEIVYSDFPDKLDLKITCETGLAVTLDNTAYASLANTGEIIASGNIVIDGDKAEFAVLEGAGTVNGVGGVIRVKYSQTAIA